MTKRRETYTYPFHHVEEEAIEAKQPTHTPYELAFIDKAFMLRRELRANRLLLEYLKAEMIQQEERIESTIVIFGSARLLSREQAQENLNKIENQLKENPKDETLKKELQEAKEDLRRSHFYEEARKLSSMIASYWVSKGERELVVMTGGGPGIMEAANRGAHEANAKNIGLNIMLPHEQLPNPYITPELNLQFHYFAIRKMHFLLRAKALIFFPGGFGTLDELFEVLTLMQTKKIRPMPLLLFHKEYWSKLINFQLLVDEKMISPNDLAYFQFVDTAEKAWEVLRDQFKLNHDYKNPKK